MSWTARDSEKSLEKRYRGRCCSWSSGSRDPVRPPLFSICVDPNTHCRLIADILKFEYMTQLLLDSNYLPLILKMFAHQDIDQAVAQKNDREELG